MSFPLGNKSDITRNYLILHSIVRMQIACMPNCCVYSLCTGRSADTEAPMSEKPPVHDNPALTGDNAPHLQGQRPSRPLYANTPNNNMPLKVSPNPNPAPNPEQPIRTGRDSPGFADLGTETIRASNPELNLNVSFDPSEHDGDRSFSIKPDAGHQNMNYQGSPVQNGRPRAIPPSQARYTTNTEV